MNFPTNSAFDPDHPAQEGPRIARERIAKVKEAQSGPGLPGIPPKSSHPRGSENEKTADAQAQAEDWYTRLERIIIGVEGGSDGYLDDLYSLRDDIYRTLR